MSIHIIIQITQLKLLCAEFRLLYTKYDTQLKLQLKNMGWIYDFPFEITVTQNARRLNYHILCKHLNRLYTATEIMGRIYDITIDITQLKLIYNNGLNWDWNVGFGCAEIYKWKNSIQ